MLKTKRCREVAQSIMQSERDLVWEQQNDSPYEKYKSTAQSSQNLAVKKLVRQSCLDAHSEEDLKKLNSVGSGNQNEAVTYWSHELIACNKPDFPDKPLKQGPPLFARSTSFTNDIKDSRLRHSEAGA